MTTTTTTNIDESVRRVAELEAQMATLALELKAHKATVTAFLADTQATRYVAEDFEAILRPGKPSFDYDGLLAVLGEHLSPEDRNTLCPPTRPCRMCKGSGEEPGVVNGTVAKKIRSYAPRNGIDYARVIDEHTVRGEPSLWVKRKE